MKLFIGICNKQKAYKSTLFKTLTTQHGSLQLISLTATDITQIFLPFLWQTRSFLANEKKARGRRKKWKQTWIIYWTIIIIETFLLLAVERRRRKYQSTRRGCDVHADFMPKRKHHEMASRREHKTEKRIAKSIVVLQTVRAFKSFSVDSEASTLPWRRSACGKDAHKLRSIDQ